MSKLEIENRKLKARVKALQDQLAKHKAASWEDELKALVYSKSAKVETFLRNGGVLPSNYNHPDKSKNISLYQAAYQRAVNSGPKQFIEQLKVFIAQ